VSVEHVGKGHVAEAGRFRVLQPVDSRPAPAAL
jgi:hypothetical protein